MDLTRLIDLAQRYEAENQGKLPALSVLRREMPSGIEAYLYEPVMCLILQGGKTVAIGDQSVTLRAGDALLVSHELPVVSRITEASAAHPYLAVIVTLERALLRGLYEVVAEADVPGPAGRSLSAGPAGQDWLGPLARYLELMDDPMDGRVLGPSTLREIHYRLLVSPIGGMLRELLVADSHANRIARVIARMRAEMQAPPGVPELARVAGMSASSFHEHFKAVTGTTPLQYLKDLRLIQARELLVGEGQSVSEAAFAVGYESPTHFSRDFSRKFGLPPSRATEIAA